MFELTPFARRNSYYPFKEMDELENAFFGKSGAMTAFKTDIKDEGDKLILQADLPGFEKKDIDVNIEDGYLTITATRQGKDEDKKDNYLRRERFYGSYSRSFDISAIRAEDITGAYKDGVLELILPKKTESTPASRKLELK